MNSYRTAVGTSMGWVGEGALPPPLPITLTLPTQLQQTHAHKLTTNSAEYRILNTEYRIQNTEYRIQNTEYRIQNTEYRIQNTETLDFFVPKWHSLRSLPFQGPKSLDFHGPPLPMALEIDFTAPYKQQGH
jgi:hypothetical protein